MSKVRVSFEFELPAEMQQLQELYRYNDYRDILLDLQDFIRSMVADPPNEATVQIFYSKFYELLSAYSVELV